MDAELESDAQLEIGHVLFMDIVGFSKLLVDQQTDASHRLNQIVRTTEQFRVAEAAGRLIRLPTGDGMALVFLPARKRRRAVRWKSRALSKARHLVCAWAFTAVR
jgi:hypothetical protein